MEPRKLIIAGILLLLFVSLPLCGDAASAASGPYGPRERSAVQAADLPLPMSPAAGGGGQSAGVTAGGGARQAPASGMGGVAYKNGLLTVEVRDREIGDLLRAMARESGFAVTLGEGIAGRVSLSLTEVPVEEALRRLCVNRAIVFEVDAQKKSFRIIRAEAFAGKAEERPEFVSADAADGADAVPAVKAVRGGAQPASGSVRAMGATGERLHDSTGRRLYKSGELLVEFKKESAAKAIEALHRSLGSIVLKRLSRPNLHRVQLREGLTEREGIALYGASKLVAAVERHALRYPLKTPNDPYFPSQWGLDRIRMPEAWELTTGRPEIVIAVIDTGVDILHPDLAANIRTNTGEIPDNGIDDDGNGYIDDVHGWDFTGTERSNGDNNPIPPINSTLGGHGTYVSGVIAATGGNGLGIAGVGWNLRIMPLKVLGDTAAEMLMIDIVEAIDYAIANGARVVNCSYGGEAGKPEEQTLEIAALERLRKAGILAICAAGNAGIDNDTSEKRVYPASHDLDNIISIASAGQLDHLLATSNYGKVSVDLMAPGESILSTKACSNACTTTPCPDPCTTAECALIRCTGITYPPQSGTSFAAPHVSGVAGLILSRNPALGYARVKSVIMESVDRIATATDRLVSGGRLNAFAALSRICLPGAVSGERIRLADAILALRIASGLETAVTVCRTADADGDDRIGLGEAIHDLQFLAGLRP